MTPKQERFVQEYLVDLNATAAARRAGYSDKTADRIGPELLGKTCVAEAIQVAQVERAAQAKVDAQWVLDRLVANHDRAMQAVEVLDREGNATGVYQYSGVVANKALELIGKHLGMFVEKRQHEHTGKDGGPIQATHEHSGVITIDPAAFAAFAADVAAAGDPDLRKDGPP